VVLSVDEKTQVQTLDRTQPLLPITFDASEKRTHDYVRHGVTNLFAALNVGTGEVFGECYPCWSRPLAHPPLETSLVSTKNRSVVRGSRHRERETMSCH
jgi:hypothetical protein